MSSQDVLQTISLILAAGLVARALSELVPVPEIVLMVAFGVALGDHGLEWIHVPIDSVGAESILTVGVAFILFYGGLGLSLHVLRQVALGLGLLVLPGVVITAVITALVAGPVFGLTASAALLMGAVLAPTDPAILIPLFARMRVRAKVAQTVIAESAFNDPTGAVLALAVAAVVASGDVSIGGEVVDFLQTLAVSSAAGVAIGFVMAFAVSSRRVGIWRETPAIAALLAVSAGYLSLEQVDGSGYLGAFLAGLIVGNMELFGIEMHSRHQLQLGSFATSVAEIVTMLVFLTLGANLPLEQMRDDLGPSLAVLAVFILVARPVAVFVCTLPDRRGAWTREELLFLCWTRETGVVPAALAGILLADGVPHAEQITGVVALAIVLTLLMQATTAGWLAGRLGLIEPDVPSDTRRDGRVAAPT